MRPMKDTSDRISIAILALGGQGGGVLAEWIQHVARHHGWLAQGTSVPGVAQRTGSTVYYVELARPGTDGRLPVMAQMPMPGDVDIVIASELMETGRALLRGFSSAGRTTLIGSTHRVYAISEKAAMGDGRGSSDRIIEAAEQRSRRFIGFDMEAATDRSGSVISAIMFGALAGSDALPFPRNTFEQAIKDSGIAVPSNLKGFAEGFTAAQGIIALPVEAEHTVPMPTTAHGIALDARARAFLPTAALTNALHGLARLMDYQDAAYASLYLDRLERIAALDRAPHMLTSEAARHLALWMSYEDTIRVADLKTRASRITRVRSEVQAADGQIVDVTEYMHPRLQEIGETLPAPIGRLLLGEGLVAKMLAPFFQQGRHVRTTSLRWFLMLRLVARMRGMRRASIRYSEEQARIDSWLTLAEQLAIRDTGLAVEWIRCQRLVKGYGDTFERGLRNFTTVRDAFLALPDAQRNAEWLRQATAMALGDDEGKRLEGFLRAA
jgi:indolepyruvate ferredoxin oxidoreductase beta subunit